MVKLYLNNNKIGQQGAQHIADALKTNQVVILFLSLSHTFYLISRRHLSSLTSAAMKLDSKELNTLLMLWKLIKYSFSFYPYHTFSTSFHTDTYPTLPRQQSNWTARSSTHCWCSENYSSSYSLSILITHFLLHFTQTLTLLTLDYNEIGQQGAQHIADALKTNQVVILFLSLSHTFYLISHRPLPYFTSETIKLDSKELNILLMLWKLIK